MDKIRNNIFLGHRYDAHNDALRENKITAVLNVAADLNDPIYDTDCYKMTKVGLSDDLKNPDEQITLATKVLKHLLDHGHTVLVHCKHGMSRSPHIIAMYLATSYNMSYDDAYAEIKKASPRIMTKSRLRA